MHSAYPTEQLNHYVITTVSADVFSCDTLMQDDDNTRIEREMEKRKRWLFDVFVAPNKSCLWRIENIYHKNGVLLYTLTLRIIQ